MVLYPVDEKKGMRNNVLCQKSGELNDNLSTIDFYNLSDVAEIDKL
jgi:hypothetical protein